MSRLFGSSIMSRLHLAVVAALFATLWALDYAMFVGELTKS